jgi:hypothetical protein
MPKDILQVMISSTTKDLAEHRAKAVNAILRMHMYPLGMEHSLAASSMTPVDASLVLVDQADAYVGIFGHRYGHIPPGSSLSMTHLEYNRAVERGIPRLIFLVDAAQPMPAPDVDHPVLLERLRSELQQAQVTGFFSSADDLAAKLLHSLKELDPTRPARPESRAFSPTLREQFASLNKKIDQLTTAQYNILDVFQAVDRVAINGCAGSGKTLLAIEKALRLRNAHYRILLLCHNPHLARFMAEMTAGSGIQAFDFGTWIRGVNEGDWQGPNAWTHYEEPTQAELDNAFFHLADHPEDRYHAVIVDEGQDFDDDWWVVVEAALVDVNNSIFWIFYDSRQKLRETKLSKFPIPGKHPVLPKNCRNAGEVFQLVRRFHDQAPEGEVGLAHEGVVRKSVYRAGEEKPLMQRAVMAALDAIPAGRLAVLTTELPPEETSIFEGFSFHHLFRRSWQEVVAEDLQELKNRVYDCPHLPVPFLGMGGLPEESDVARVREFAQQVIREGRLYAKTQEAMKESDDHWRTPMRWVLEKDQLRFKKNYAPRERLMFYVHGGWAKEIPAPDLVTISASPLTARGKHLTLSTVSTFKGLEVDGAILFVRLVARDLRPFLYVGTSRPRFFLHILLDAETDLRYSAQFSRYENYTFKEHPA